MSEGYPSVLLLGDTLNFGGTEGQFVEVACGLAAAGWPVDVACMRAEGPLRARLERAGLAPWSYGPGSLKSPQAIGAVRGLARHLRARRVRIVHCFDFYSNLLGVAAGRLARVPVVIASQRDLGNLRPWHQQRLHTAMLGMATHVLVNSEAIAERLERTRAARAGRVSVILNGVDLARFAPADRAVSQPGAPVVVTLANLRPEKGLHQLVDAAHLVRQRLPAVRFEIWGEGVLRPALEEQVRRKALTETVRFQGTTREPQDVLRRCDVFVLPSLSEACSNVLMEALATGLPVVATRVGGNPGLVEDGRSGLLVPPGNPAALAEAIVQILQDQVVAARLAVGARARAVDQFAMSRMLERLQSFYRRVLGPILPATADAGLASRP